MASEMDQVLARELGRLGGFGARLVARLLPNNQGVQEFELPDPVSVVRRRVQALLAEVGAPLTPGPEAPDVGDCAVVGSGYLRMNPAVVAVRVQPRLAGGSLVSVHGLAKEGLVKQRGGEQVAREIADRLRGPCPESGQTSPTSAGFIDDQRRVGD